MNHGPQRASGDRITETEEVIERYRNAVYGLALAKTASRPDADDVFQEVFLAYFRSGKVFREEEHRKAWLLRTTINLSRRVTCSAWKKRTVPLPDDPDSQIQFSQPRENHVWTALSSLPEDYRLPLYLFYFQDLSTKEIAKALSLRPGTVRMRLSRGREQLRALLEGDDFNE